MSTFIEIFGTIIAVFMFVTYPFLCLLVGYACCESKKWEKKDTSEEVQE